MNMIDLALKPYNPDDETQQLLHNVLSTITGQYGSENELNGIIDMWLTANDITHIREASLLIPCSLNLREYRNPIWHDGQFWYSCRADFMVNEYVLEIKYKRILSVQDKRQLLEYRFVSDLAGVLVAMYDYSIEKGAYFTGLYQIGNGQGGFC